jgi:hypothetical protein
MREKRPGMRIEDFMALIETVFILGFEVEYWNVFGMLSSNQYF